MKDIIDNVTDFHVACDIPILTTPRVPGSDRVALRIELIDEEVRCIVDRAYARAKKVLTDYRDKLDTLAKMLTEAESVDKQQFDALFA